MARRCPETNRSELRCLIESSLSGRPGFGQKVRVEGKLIANHDGIGHDNYYFVVDGHRLILRLARRYRPLKTKSEARTSLEREAETLRRLDNCPSSFATPKLICTVTDDDGQIIGLIESCMAGAPVSQLQGEVNGQSRIDIIAEVAAAVHRLPKSEFSHVPSYPDSKSHVRMELNALPIAVFDEWPIAPLARDWITANESNRPSVVLHGDLLPQNLLCDFSETGTVSVIDWEYAQIGDPAYELAIVTRGSPRLLKEAGGIQRLLAMYNEKSGAALPAAAVRIHELLLHLRWLADSARDLAAGKLDGHGPEQYALKIQAMLRRFESN